MKIHGIFHPTWFAKAYLWGTELLYGPLAWAYDGVAWLVSFGYWSHWRLDALEYIRPGSVLEIGFGTGELLIALAEGGREVIGLELSTKMQRVTGRKLQKRSMSVKRVQGRTEVLPFPKGSFDNVLATFPSNYILKQKTLQEIHRVLHRDGRCIIVGLGVKFSSGCKRWLSNLWLGSASEPMIQDFLTNVTRMGFTVRRVDHQAEDYTLSVLVMEHTHAD